MTRPATMIATDGSGHCQRRPFPRKSRKVCESRPLLVGIYCPILTGESDHFRSGAIVSVLPYEKLYLENLPDTECYEKSYMHRDVITHLVTTKTDFIITASTDGHLKFWKKIEDGIEFVKHFRSHLSECRSLGLLANRLAVESERPIVIVLSFGSNVSTDRRHKCVGGEFKRNVSVHSIVRQKCQNIRRDQFRYDQHDQIGL